MTACLAATAVACGADARTEPDLYIPEPTPWSPTPPKKEAERPQEERPPRIPNPADGKCERARVSSGVVDPDCVYLFSTVRDQWGFESEQVLIDPFRPEDRAFGFARSRRIMVHPKTGELWFLAHDERHPMAMYVLEENLTFYAGMLSKQRWIPSPSCPRFPEPFDFHLFADDGMPAYMCTTGETLVSWRSAPFDVSGYVFLALSHDRAALGYNTLAPPSQSYAVIKDGSYFPVGWTSYQRFVTARSRAGGGFIAVTVGGTFPDHLPKLWNVELDGTIWSRGSYDMGTDGRVDPQAISACEVDAFGKVACATLGYSCALEASGALYCVTQIGRDGKRFVEGVVRLRLSAPPQIVHDERASDVKVTIDSQLVTGP